MEDRDDKKLIDAVTECIQEGQPNFVIVCANPCHAQYIRDALHYHLLEKGEKVVEGRPCYGMCLYVDDGQTVRFETVSNMEHFRVGHRGFGEFWTDFAEYTKLKCGFDNCDL